MQAPSRRGSTASSAPSGFSLPGRPQLLARARQLERDPLRPRRRRGRAPCAAADPSRSASWRPLCAQLLDHLVRIAPRRRLGLLAENARISSSVTSMPSRVGDRLEHQLARDRAPRVLGTHALLELLRRLAGHREVGLERDPAALERRARTRAGARRRAPRRARRTTSTLDASTSASTAAARNCALEPPPRPARRGAASMSARSSASVSNSLAERASSSSSGGRTVLLDLLDASPRRCPSRRRRVRTRSPSSRPPTSRAIPASISGEQRGRRRASTT